MRWSWYKFFECHLIRGYLHDVLFLGNGIIFVFQCIFIQFLFILSIWYKANTGVVLKSMKARIWSTLFWPLFPFMLMFSVVLQETLEKVESTNRNTGIKPSRQLLFKVNNKNTRTRCEICSELIIKIPGIVLPSLLLTLNIFHTLF